MSVEEVVGNLAAEIKKIEGRNMKGLLRAVIPVRKDAVKDAPIVTGNLRASVYTKALKRRVDTVEIGFSAVYALKVHENPRAGKTGMSGASTKGGWKFLENALKNNQGKMLKIIQQEARIR